MENKDRKKKKKKKLKFRHIFYENKCKIVYYDLTYYEVEKKEVGKKKKKGKKSWEIYCREKHWLWKRNEPWLGD